MIAFHLTFEKKQAGFHWETRIQFASSCFCLKEQNVFEMRRHQSNDLETKALKAVLFYKDFQS